MSDIKYSIGPWHVAKYGTQRGKVQTIVQGIASNICRMDIADRLQDTLDADAQLIAAAPDLLAVAIKADELVQEFVGVNSPDEPFLIYSLPREVQDLIHELMGMANKAIAAAKATA